MRLQGKNALVTGASSGIGYATSIKMAEDGANVAFTYCNNKKGAEKLKSELESKGIKSVCIQANMNKDEEVEKVSSQVIEEFGKVDILFNNAGGLVERMPFFEINRPKWDEIFELNVWSVVLLTQRIGANMKDHGGGVVINNASVAGRFGGGVGAMAYSTAKGAVITLTKSMGRELITDGIRVNGIAPGIIETPFHDKFTPPDVMEGLLTKIPIQRAGSSEEMASIVTFLASDDSSYLVGVTIDANGGMWVV